MFHGNLLGKKTCYHSYGVSGVGLFPYSDASCLPVSGTPFFRCNKLSRLDHKSRRLFLSLPIDGSRFLSKKELHRLNRAESSIKNRCFFDDFFLTAATVMTLKVARHRVTQTFFNFFFLESQKHFKGIIGKRKKSFYAKK